MTDFIPGKKLIDELIKQGIADEQTNRVTIDIPVNGIPTIFVEKVGDKRLIDIMPALTAGAVVTAQMDNVDTREFGEAPDKEIDWSTYQPDTVSGPYGRHSVPREGGSNG